VQLVHAHPIIIHLAASFHQYCWSTAFYLYCLGIS